MFNMIQSGILIGLGILIENPNKRVTVLKSLDGIGKYAVNSVNTILPKAAKSPDKQAEPTPEYK